MPLPFVGKNKKRGKEKNNPTNLGSSVKSTRRPGYHALPPLAHMSHATGTYATEEQKKRFHERLSVSKGPSKETIEAVEAQVRKNREARVMGVAPGKLAGKVGNQSVDTGKASPPERKRGSILGRILRI